MAELQLWLCSSMFPGTAVKQAHLAVALISCCSFCFIFSHLIDWVVPSQKALHSNGFLLSLQAGAFYIFSLPYPLYSSRECNCNCSNPTPFVSQMRLTENFCIKTETLFEPSLAFLRLFSSMYCVTLHTTLWIALLGGSDPMAKCCRIFVLIWTHWELTTLVKLMCLKTKFILFAFLVWTFKILLKSSTWKNSQTFWSLPWEWVSEQHHSLVQVLRQYLHTFVPSAEAQGILVLKLFPLRCSSGLPAQSCRINSEQGLKYKEFLVLTESHLHWAAALQSREHSPPMRCNQDWLLVPSLGTFWIGW